MTETNQTAETEALVLAPIRALLASGCFGGLKGVDPYALYDALMEAERRLAELLSSPSDLTTGPKADDE